MDSSKTVSASSQSSSIETTILEQLKKKKKTSNQSALGTGEDDTTDIGMSEIYKSLTILGDKIISKLNELLKEQVPGGIGSLDPEQHTAEATAQRIVDGATALFSIFSQQNPDMEGEELISSFMETIRGGIQNGYEDASAILGDLGAFEFEGVEEGIQETMRLVEDKLKAFEDDYRKKNGLTVTQDEQEDSASAAQETPSDQSQQGVKVTA